MKIVFVLPNLSSGGAERVVSILMSELLKHNISVDLVLLHDDLIQYLIPSDVNIVRLNTLHDNRLERIKKIRVYLKSIRKEHPIIVPFQDSCLKNILLASRGLRIPIIATERNNPFRKGASKIKRLKASLPFKMADFAVFQTYDARNYYDTLPNKKCAVIPNPIVPSEETWNGNCDEDKLIAVCRLHKQKNIPLLIDAIEFVKERYQNVKVSIYGEGELFDKINEYASSKGLSQNIVLCGRTDNTKSVLAKSSIYLSSSDFEGISNSMLEAMSVGMPIVCTDCPIGGANMMLSDGAGILTPVGDAKAFAEAIIRILEDKLYARQIAEKGLAVSKNYSPEKITDSWLNIFKSLENK